MAEDNNNKELIRIFQEISIYFLMKDVAFKPQAYQKAVLTIEALTEDVEDIYKKGGGKALVGLPGIGKNIADKIVEYLEKGKIKEYQELKKEIPVELGELSAVEGVGPKTIRDLYKKLKVKNLKDLERMAKSGKIRELPNFGLKTEENILESIGFLKRNSGRFPLGFISKKAERIIKKLKDLREVKKISSAGSFRRGKETIGDVDILVATDKPQKVVGHFTSLPGVVKVWGQGGTKASIRMKEGFDVDLRVVSSGSFGSALQYFTGSKEHNIATRKIANDKGLKLNEYGLFKGKKKIAGKTEEEIYKKLKMQFVPPEIRENRGEVAVAQVGELPKLIEDKDIKGELHCHSHWNISGRKGVEGLVEAATELGYSYIGISDHTKFLAIEHGLSAKELLAQNSFIKKLNEKMRETGRNFRVLHGCEANIMANGSIDIDDKTLAKLDYVIAGVHSQLKMPKGKITKRIITAMRNPNVDIISHITGRIIQRRDEYELDFDKILEVARETKTVLEINANPSRLDLKDVNIRKAKEAGIKMVINSDAHKPEQMLYLKYGITQARRGWAEKKDIINAWPVDKLLKMLK